MKHRTLAIALVLCSTQNMARLPALIEAFVRTDGRDRSAIDHVARVIREHGLIPTTKRGTGAADMTSREAVNLLFALNGASSPKDSVEAVERLRLLSQSDAADCADPAFDALRDITGLGEALEYLIDEYPSVLKFFGLPLNNTDAYIFNTFQIKIEIGYAWGNILLIGDSPKKYLFRASYRLSVQDAAKYLGNIPDRQVVTSLSARTIHELWHCIARGRPARHD